MRSKYILPALGAGLIGLLAGAGSASAAPPTLVQQVTQHGDFVLIGNTVGQDCSGGVPMPVVGTIGQCTSSGSAPSVLWQSDNPAAGQATASTGITPDNARSTAVLQLPAGANVTHAYLYWASTVAAAGAKGATATIERPGVFTQMLTADDAGIRTVAYGDTNNVYAYQSRKDVTDIVQANGSGAYRVGGFATIDLSRLVNNNDAFVGWWMVVIYQLPSEPLRNLAFYDAFSSVNQATPVNTTLDGFHVPDVGTISAKLGVIAWEGDNVIQGDQLFFVDMGTPLSNDLNPANNFFNSTRSQFNPPGAATNASPISIVGDLPQLTGGPGSMSGVDIDIVDVSTRLHNGDTSAALRASTTTIGGQNDSYVLGGFVLSTEVVAPDFTTSTKTFVDATRAGEAILPGDVLTYTIKVPNTGTVDSKNTKLTDVLPAGVTYVPESIKITAGANVGSKTDAAGDDQAQYDAASNTVTVWLGDGAAAGAGGNIAVGSSTTVTFQVKVNADAKGATISNQAKITANGATDPDGAPSTDTLTSSDPAKPGSSTDTTPIDECEPGTNSGCSNPTPICKTTTGHPYNCVGCAHDSDCAGNPNGPSCDPDAHTCGPLQPCDPGDPANHDKDCGDANSGRVCDDTTKTCKDGCRGENGNGCPDPEVCSSTTADIGTCNGGGGGGKHCEKDSDCGQADSGKVCDDTTKVCKDGCRGVGGNHCPSEQVCSSTDTKVGTCGPGDPCNPAHGDSDCGNVNSGRVCNETIQNPVCQDGCRGEGGNRCAGGEACSSTTAEIGICSGEQGIGDIRVSGNGVFSCSAGPDASSNNANSTLWVAGAVAAVMVASRRRKKGDRSERV